MQFSIQPLRYLFLFMSGLLLLLEICIGLYLVAPNYVCADEHTENRAVSALEAEGKRATIDGPGRKNGLLGGMLGEEATEITLSLATDRRAVCQYSTFPRGQYVAMTGRMASVNGFDHASIIPGLNNGEQYSYYVKFKNRELIANTDDYIVNFAGGYLSDTKIERSPSKITEKTTATFIFSSRTAVKYYCSLDTGPYVSCSSPVKYSNLLVGPHVFQVKAVNEIGIEDRDPVVYSWNIWKTFNKKELQLLFDDDYLDML